MSLLKRALGGKGSDQIERKRKKLLKEPKTAGKSGIKYQKKLEPSKKISDKKKVVRKTIENSEEVVKNRDKVVKKQDRQNATKNNLKNEKFDSGKVSKKKFVFGKVRYRPGVEESKKAITDYLKDVKGKPDWKDLKKKAKELTIKRKEHKFSQFDVTVKAKKLWEQVRRADCPPEKASKLTAELYGLLKDQFQKMVFVHDMARIVQWLLKLGAPSIRDAITEELKPVLEKMVHTKYASFCVKRMLKYGSQESRSTVIRSFRGNVVKCMAHNIASPVVEYAYDHWANVDQRNALKQEFYGNAYKLAVGDVGSQSLTEMLSKAPHLKKMILEDTKKNLLHILVKGLFKSTLVLTVLMEYLNSCTPEDRDELLTIVRPHILSILHIREGSRAGMMCCWFATPKDRKKMMKSLKGLVTDLAVSEHGHLMLLALFDSVDDTVALNKLVLTELLADAHELAADEHGRKVLLYLVAHRDPLYFHPSLLNLLVPGDSSDSIKKDMYIREAELRDAVITPLLESVANDPAAWLKSGSIAMVTLAILKAGKGEKLESAFQAIAKHLCHSDSKIVENEVSYPILEHSGIHMVLKKIIQHDKEVLKRGDVSFSSMLTEELTDKTISRGITCNRFCFLLVAVLESGVREADELLREKLDGTISKQLKKQKSVGATILRQKLAVSS